MDILCLGRQLEVNKLHILPAAKAEICHEGLQENLGTGKPIGQRSSNDSVEQFRLLNATRDVEELEQRMKILDVVHTSSC